MECERIIRRMTPEEAKAKREWGTSACQVRGCAARAIYLIREFWSDQESGSREWWQYCCLRHAKAFASQHRLPMPPAADPELSS
jgi:hypothetical protein